MRVLTEPLRGTQVPRMPPPTLETELHLKVQPSQEADLQYAWANIIQIIFNH